MLIDKQVIKLVDTAKLLYNARATINIAFVAPAKRSFLDNIC